MIHNFRLYLAENRVQIIQVLRFVQCNEELRAISIRAVVGHRQQAAVRESQPLMEFVFERAPKGRFAAIARARRITALDHEIFHQSMENSAVKIVLQAVLHEIAARKWGLYS